MRLVPLSKRSVLPLALAAAVPVVAVLALQIPLVELLKRLAGALL
jgi:hypothetical protein